MGLNSIVFLSEPLETVPWFFQQMVLAIAYVLLLRKEGRDGETKKSILKMASESIVLLLLFIAASLFFMGFFTKHFLVLWCVFQAVLLGAYFISVLIIRLHQSLHCGVLCTQLYWS